MATVEENLTTARENFARILAEISASPKPNYSIDGQSVSWMDYLRFLREEIDKIDVQLAGGDYFEEVSELY